MQSKIEFTTKSASTGRTASVDRLGSSDLSFFVPSDYKRLFNELRTKLHKKSESPAIIAQKLKELKAVTGLSWSKIERAVRLSRTHRKLLLSILTLPEEIARNISFGEPGRNGSLLGKLSLKHARALYLLRHDPLKQRALYQSLLGEGKGANSTLQEVLSRLDKKQIPSLSDDPNIKAAIEQLIHRFGTKVEIEPRSFGGEFIIQFYSVEDMMRIYELLRGSTGRPHLRSK